MLAGPQLATLTTLPYDNHKYGKLGLECKLIYSLFSLVMFANTFTVVMFEKSGFLPQDALEKKVSSLQQVQF